MKRISLILLTIILVFPTARADRFTDMAQNIFNWLKTGQADSILSNSSPQIKAALAPQMIKGLWPQLLMQGGELQEEREWTQTMTLGYNVRQKVLVFERIALLLNVVFNKDVIMEGINFSPVTRPVVTNGESVSEADTTTFKERPFVVNNGEKPLPGTLTLPVGRAEKLPAVVLVHGSGPLDRDETVGSNKPFRELAHALARRGIIVARYDKRTYVYKDDKAGMEDGNMTLRTETADDAAEAIKIVCNMSEVDSRHVFVLGHSLGGTCLPLIAESAQVKPAGLIGMAALARPFWQAVHEQLAYIFAGNDSVIAQKERQMRDSIPKEYLDFIETYKPLDEMAKTRGIPCLFLQGGNDYQVTETDLSLWRDALKENKEAEFKFFPNLDHLFRPLTKMATPNDYSVNIPMSEEAIEAIASFILNNYPPPRLARRKTQYFHLYAK